MQAGLRSCCNLELAGQGGRCGDGAALLPLHGELAPLDGAKYPSGPGQTPPPRSCSERSSVWAGAGGFLLPLSLGIPRPSAVGPLLLPWGRMGLGRAASRNNGGRNLNKGCVPIPSV